jgi:iron(III) transport system permease protein
MTQAVMPSPPATQEQAVGEPVRRRAIPKPSVEHAVFWMVILAIGALVVAPLSYLVYTSLHLKGGGTWNLTLDNFGTVFGADYGIQVIVNSFAFAVGGAGGAILLGTLLAWMVERTDAPFRRFTYTVMFISIALPGLFKVVGWIVLLGPGAGFINNWARSIFGEWAVYNIFSLSGMIFVEILLWVPTAFLLMVAPLRQMDRTLEDAAEMCGAKRFRVLSRITFPLLAPAIGAVGLLALVRMFEAFEVPALIGLPGRRLVLTSVIYQEMTHGITPSYEQPSAYAVLLMIPVSIGLVLYLRMLSRGERYQVVTGKGFKPRVVELGRWRWAAGSALIGLCGLLLLPMLVLLWASFTQFIVPPSPEAFSHLTLDHYRGLLEFPRLAGAVKNTAIVSLAAATVVMVIASLASWIAVKSRLRGKAVVDYLAMSSLVFPGIVLGLALLQLYLRVPLGIYNTLTIIILALATRYLPFGMRYASTGLIQIHSELEESGASAGGTWRQVFMRITVPLAFPALFAGWVFIFLNAATELSASVLLAGPRSQVLSVLLFELWQEGQVNQTGALAVVISIPLVIVALFLHRMAGKVGTHV